MFAGSVTFSLSITGLNATNFLTITNVGFGLGPDSANAPDNDDVGAATPVPEPPFFVMLGLGVGAIVIGRSRGLICR